uniref:Transmembrane channel-like protein n=1 Tax=Saimiri boliviensis boliviensis TaxID=39432 RepID=A0A2K6U3H1_SAIBB
MEENPTLDSAAWGSSSGWLAPREARGASFSSPGRSLSSVLNELPSAATLRYRGPGVVPWGTPEEEEEDGGSGRQAFAEATQTELQDPHPSRELPWPMQARRAHRQSHARDQLVRGAGSRMDQWARLLRRSKEKTKEGLQRLQPWAWTLKRIGGAAVVVVVCWDYRCEPPRLACPPLLILSTCRFLWVSIFFSGLPTPAPFSGCLSVSGLKQTLLAESGALTSYSHLVFSAWDFGLCGDVHVRLRQRIILYELQVCLGGRVCNWVGIRKGWAQIIWVESERIPLRREPPRGPILLCLPLARTLFLRLASLVVLLFSLWNQITCGGDAEAEDCKTCGYNYKELPCWETLVGQEMYKLLLFDLLTGLAVALLIQFPRKLLCGLCPGALGRLAGTQEFQVPDEVLGLVYAQTVVWVGSFFCPLLPLLNTVKFLLLFYLKKLTLFFSCSPAARTFRASTANFFFPLVLLLGLAISSVPLLYSIFLIPPSKLCGPFRGQSSIWAQIPESISSLPETAQNFLFFLGTQAFAVPLLLISSILMAYTVALANSYGRLISQLKRQRETEAQNKVFLARRAVALSTTNPAF